MYTGRVNLEYTPGGGWVFLRELTGRDELGVSGSSTVDAIQLLDGLLTSVPGCRLGPGRAAELTAPDRDRVLAETYVKTWGTRVRSTAHCASCAAPFDLDFSIPEAVESLPKTRCARDPNGMFVSSSGVSFRLPTGVDECEILHLPPEVAEQELAKRCSGGVDVQDEMESAAPLIDLELNGTCPECGAVQTFRFDIQSYVLTALHSERDRLASEVHRLARAYGWSASEILSLPRSQRRRHVSILEAESSRRA